MDEDNDDEEGGMSWFSMMIPFLIGQLFIKLLVCGRTNNVATNL